MKTTNKHKKKQKNTVFILVLLPLLAVVLSSYAVFKGIRNYIETSSYFKIRKIQVDGITDERYCRAMREEIVGTNIFRVDTRKLSERIRRKFPTFYSVTVMRVLPSCLVIEARERLPVAVMQEGGISYLIDTEGVVVSTFPSTKSEDFPLIVGLEGKMGKLRLGSRYSSGTLRNVLSLAKALRSQRFGMRVTRIDASNPSDLCFYLGKSLQVKVGRNDFENKVSLLPAILKSLSDEVSSVKYIDLRPNEPVVASKKTNK